ncbi:acetylxylan esterase [Paenibacillus mendelii]|uniref:Acetylxylan esterase n=1 Tax=Paenibacillus mendelii TaxID=206163 RepID=A0ABV6JJ60_9BACL|nr:acetylxylan esterase [Paenibacillus mendelii]MCQ6558473.1 acetylxylan esterase [Paenibacillus mendelii]
MPLHEMPYEEFVSYKPKLTMEPDFHSFWGGLQAESSRRPLRATMEKSADPYKLCSVYRVQFEGMDGSPVRGWYLTPAGASAYSPVPALVRYHGYTGSDRAYPHHLTYWCSLGMAVLSIDIRGQAGDTPDPGVYANDGITGWITRGLLDRDNYYYKQVFMDCLRAVDFVCERAEVNSQRVAVYGESQGGGIALMAGALDSRPKLVLSIFPFLCHWRRSVDMAADVPYKEITQWFVQYDPARTIETEVFRTLSYYDAMNMASLVKARTFMGITLQDTCCPPPASFAAYNHLNAPKELIVNPDYGHVGGIPSFQEAMMRFLDRYL